MFFRSKGKKDSPDEMILGMVLLNDDKPFDLKLFINDFNEHTSYKVGEVTSRNDSVAFTIGRMTVVIGSMPVPVPRGDIEGTAQYAYNWPDVIDDLREHKGHFIVSIMEARDILYGYRLFTAVICSLLRTSNAIGVYKGAQSLLIPKEDYLEEADFMDDDWYPLNLWIYFGVGVSNGKSSGYTYGLKQFNKLELEILDSDREPEDVRTFLYNIAHYILEYNVTFKDGQTCGVSENERIKISLSPGRLVDTDSFKLAY